MDYKKYLIDDILAFWAKKSIDYENGGIFTCLDEKGNIYESDDWTKGHGHKNVHNGYERDKDDKRSKGRPWKNPWLRYDEEFDLIESFNCKNESLRPVLRLKK